MRVPATPSWVLLSVVVGAPRHSWLRAPGAVPRHSWPGSAGGGGVWPLATPGCGSRSWFPATPGWEGPLVAVLGGPLPLLAEGLVGGSPPLLARVRWLRRCVFPRVGNSRVVCACGAAFLLWCLCWCVWCVFVVSVLVVVWVWACLSRAFVCVCVCACVVCWWCVLLCGVVCWWGRGRCVVWLVPRHSWRRFLCATSRHSWMGFAAGGGGRSSPVLASGPRVRFPATPGWGPPAVVVCGSPPLLAGARFRAGPGWGLLAAVMAVSAGFDGGFPCCVCLWRGACWCVCCVFVAVVWVWVCLPCVLARVWRRVAVCFPGWGLLLVLVWVGV